MPDDFPAEISIPSPDRAKRVQFAKDYSFRIFSGEHEVGVIRLEELNSNIDVIWSPDSKKFFITYSEGGAIGGFVVHVYSLAQNVVTELSKPPQVAFDDFKSRYYCKIRGDNIYALGWTPDSAGLFFITEVYPTGDCGSIAGKANGYVVSLDGKILAHYGDRQARAIEASCEKTGRAVLLQPRIDASR